MTKKKEKRESRVTWPTFKTVTVPIEVSGRIYELIGIEYRAFHGPGLRTHDERREKR